MASSRFLSLREYAASRKRRKLTGGTHAAVRKAIGSGRLTKSVRTNARGKPLIDADLADIEWSSRTDPTQMRTAPAKPQAKQTGLFPEAETPRPGDTSGAAETPTVTRLREAQANRMHFRSLVEELNYRNRASELAEVAKVDQETTRLIEPTIKAIFAVPDRVCSHLAATNDAHRCKMIMSEALTLACRELLKRLSNEQPAT